MTFGQSTRAYKISVDYSEMLREAEELLRSLEAEMTNLEKLDGKKELDIETFKSSFGLVKQNTLHVGNIPYHFEKQDLIDLFKDCGAILDVKIPQDRGRKKGFAFVTLENDRAAKKALNYDGHRPMQRGKDGGRPIRV